MASMIFHHPYLINDEGNSGSQVRPYQMLKAFRRIGYDVDVISGYGRERKKEIRKIKIKVSKGKVFDFVYSESSTMPTLLTETHHYPIYPFLDFGFLGWAKKNLIPIGLFYRDMHWRFSHYKNSVSPLKRAASIPLYKYDWVKYQRLLDHLFLPTLELQDVLPGSWDINKMSALPPGCRINLVVDKRPETLNSGLRLFYVGGVTPPLYNLNPLFRTVNDAEGAHLTLCCREKEWKSVQNLYKPFNKKKVDIIHQSGSRLQKYYSNADIFALLWDTYEYLEYAMPVKVFESIGNGLPVMTLNGTAVARFVQQENIGWVVNSVEEAKCLMVHLSTNRGEVNSKTQEVLRVRNNHTWDNRAKTVARVLNSLRREI